MQPIFGLDLGGTKIEGVVLSNIENLQIISRLRIPTEANKGYEHILKQVAKLVELLSIDSGYDPKAIGIGTPGVLDPITQTMKNCNTTAMNGKFMKRDLMDLLQIPVEISNDANCFAVAETRLGIVRDVMPNAKLVFGVIMGTGVGGGIVINGEVWDGRHGIGGEWGHSFLDESGGKCFCGNTGCVETLISGTGLQRYYAAQSGKNAKLSEILKAHQNNTDPIATATIQRLIHFFGKGIANIINILDPDVIVIGGGVGNIDLLYTEGIESVRKFVLNNQLDTQILKPKLGDSAGVFGAALLVAR
jgi:predicted NBD/HSP70 family sugar kinase